VEQFEGWRPSAAKAVFKTGSYRSGEPLRHPKSSVFSQGSEAAPFQKQLKLTHHAMFGCDIRLAYSTVTADLN
jgi:hypothetical protein